MTAPGPSTQDRLAKLAVELDALERAVSPKPAPPPPPPKPPQPQLSKREKRARRWLFWIIQAWGAFGFILIAMPHPGRLPLWQLPLVAAFIVALGWGVYGGHLFYWQLGKELTGWARRKLRSENSGPAG